jgi:pyruvate dehydrogenase E2 component (dihydrolipoamide acetyltransferase)
MTDFTMPALGADMEFGTLAEWNVKPGDHVKSGDVICVVETQKGAIDVEVFHTGTVAELLVGPGARVPVGTLLARIQIDGEAPAAAAPPPPPTAAPPPPPPPTTGRVRASPVARREAAARGIDLAGVCGSGMGGAVTLADLPAAASPAPRPATRGFDAAEMRRAIAAAMSRAKREIPHYYLSETIDLARAMAWLEAFNAARPPPERLLPAVLLLKAAALALREEKLLNGTYEGGVFTPGAGIHAGWAIALRGGGLIAPAIRDTDARTLPELMVAVRDLVQRARSGGLRLSELTGGTITITSLGERGAESVTGVIYPPQVAIVGFGRVAPRAVVTADGTLAAHPTVVASLAADHRVTDGHLGGRYLAAVARLLQEPETL